MGINLSLLGDKVRRYREQLLLSVEELSVASGIETSRLKSIEAGHLEPSGDEVLIFADVFRCDYKFFVSGEGKAPFQQTDELYRRYGTEFSKEDRRNIQEVLFLCETEKALESILQRPLPSPPISFQKKGNYFKGHAAEAAIAVRRALHLKPNEVSLNVYDDIRRFGVRVFRRQLGNSNISGLFIKHPTAGKCIVVNYSEDVYRQRFTAAHEFGHTILDDERDVVVSFTKWDHKDLVEIRANNFASQYLLPPETLRSLPSETWTDDGLVEWASKLKVSVSALVNALDELGIVDGDHVRRGPVLRVPPEEKIDPELPDGLSTKGRVAKARLLKLGLSDYYASLCFDAYSQAEISRGRLAECLLIDDAELSAISQLYGRQLRHAD